MTCDHNRTTPSWTVTLFNGGHASVRSVEVRRCFDCREWFPLEPSNDTPDALVELRAAELSLDEPGSFSLIESHGWFDWETDYGPGIDYSEKTFARWSAGWLGRAINEHDKEQP